MKWIEKKARTGHKRATGNAQLAEAEETGSAEVIDIMELLMKSMKKGDKKRTSGVSAKKKSQAANKRKRKSLGNRRKAS